MKQVIKKSIVALTTILLVTLCVTSCYMPKKDISSKNFVFETLTPCYLSVNGYKEVLGLDTITIAEAEALRPRRFKCKIVDGKIQNIDYLVLAGLNTDNGLFFGREIGDTAYYRRIPVVHREDLYFKKKYTKYYIPDRALYWEFQDISIVSDNANFGADYPVGSDLTPIVLLASHRLWSSLRTATKGPIPLSTSYELTTRRRGLNLKCLKRVSQNLSSSDCPQK